MSKIVENVLESLNTDKFYKIIGVAGVIFTSIGGIYGSSQMIQIGLLTFVYGIFTWMLGEGFHIQAKITLPEGSKVQPIHFVVGYILLLLIAFSAYVFLLLGIQKG